MIRESHGENIDDSGNVERGEYRRSDAADGEFIEADAKRARPRENKQAGSGMMESSPDCNAITRSKRVRDRAIYYVRYQEI